MGLKNSVNLLDFYKFCSEKMGLPEGLDIFNIRLPSGWVDLAKSKNINVRETLRASLFLSLFATEEIKRLETEFYTSIRNKIPRRGKSNPAVKATRQVL